jgi:hypothetical protein
MLSSPPTLRMFLACRPFGNLQRDDQMNPPEQMQKQFHLLFGEPGKPLASNHGQVSMSAIGFCHFHVRVDVKWGRHTGNMEDSGSWN